MAKMKVIIGGDATALDKTFNSVEKRAGNLSKNFSGIFASLGAGLSVAGIISYTKTVIDNLDQIGKSAKRIGISAEEFQKLAYAQRKAGATTENVERAFKKMQQTILDAQQGLKTAQDSFEILNINVDELKNLSPEKQFALIAGQVSKVNDSTSKAAIAQEVFGRAGTNIIPMIDNYKQLGDELERVGGIIRDEDVKAAEDFKDEIEVLSVVMQGLTTKTGIIPWLSDVTKGMRETITETKSFWQKMLEFSTDYFERTKYLSPTFFVASKILDMQGTKKRYEIAAPKKSEIAGKNEKIDIKKQLEDQKKQKEIDAKIAEETKKKAEAEEKIAQEKEKQAQAIKDMMSDNEFEIRQQELKNKGLERQAEIEEQIRKAKEKNANITEEELNIIEEQAGKLFDLQQKEVVMKDDSKKDMNMPAKSEVLDLERIGAIYGAGDSKKDQTVQIQKKIENISKEQLKVQKEIRDKENANALGAV